MADTKPLDFKLIVLLSMFGPVMALATVWIIPSNIEPLFWLAIFLICAWVIARRAPGRYFLHGLCVSLVNCVWITSAHMLFVQDYLARHAREAASLQSSPMPDSPRLMMAIMGPVIGLVFGIVLGTFALIASKVVAPKRA